MVKPKKRRVKIILIIILSRIALLLQNDILTGQDYDIEAALKLVEAMSDEFDEDSWNEDQNKVYDAADELGVALEEESEDLAAPLAKLLDALEDLS